MDALSEVARSGQHQVRPAALHEDLRAVECPDDLYADLALGGVSLAFDHPGRLDTGVYFFGDGKDVVAAVVALRSKLDLPAEGEQDLGGRGRQPRTLRYPSVNVSSRMNAMVESKKIPR